MFDSGKSGGARSSGISLSSTAGSQGTVLTLKADPAWLGTSARTWPVKIDPTSIVGDMQDCYLNAGSPTTSFCGGTVLNAGFDGTNASRAFLQFNLAAVPSTNPVVSAKLPLYLGSASTTTPTSPRVHPLTHASTSAPPSTTYNRSTSS